MSFSLRRVIVATATLVAGTSLAIVSAPRPTAALGPHDGYLFLRSVSPDGRIVVFNSEFGNAVRFDRLTGERIERSLFSNWLVPSVSGAYVTDTLDSWTDLVTGATTTVTRGITQSDLTGDIVALTQPQGGSAPRVERRSTGEILAYPGSEMVLSTSGRYVVHTTSYLPVRAAALLDLRDSTTYPLPPGYRFASVADDGTVVLLDPADAATAFNPITGARRPLSISVITNWFLSPNRVISTDGTVVLGRIGDRMAVQHVRTGVVSDLGPWPESTDPLRKVSRPLLQPDGSAVVYSVSVRAGEQWTTTLVDTPVPGRVAPHVRAGEVVPLDLSPMVPPGARAASLNVTVTTPVGPGYLTVYPCGTTVPLASNVNFAAGQTIPNGVITGLDSSSRACLYASVDLDVVVDVQGAVPATSSFVPVIPTRVLDTRIATGVASPGSVPAGGTVRVQVAGATGIPADARTAVLNVTVTEPQGSGFVTAYPCGERPTASNLNFTAGRTIANLVVAPLDASGGVCLYTSSATHLVADVGGTFPAVAGIVGREPTRVLDSRTGLGTAAGTTRAGTVTMLDLAGQGVREGDVAVLNVTATEPTLAGFVTVWPCGLDRPLASTVNYAPGETIPNLALATAGAGGRVCLYSFTDTHLVVDLSATIRDADAYVGRAPVRALDSRQLLPG